MILCKTSQCMKTKMCLEKLPTYFANYAIDRDKKCLSEQYNIMIGKDPAI